ncbi:MAG: carbon-nitrogen hydrolase family protein [Planctomycetota bacterium]|nr:carbon-nitrogen hydrolase family protein [Planctomycetota bacterium]
MPLRVASAQFPVSADLAQNADHVRTQIAEAAAGGARLIAFPETALSGYTPTEFPSLATFDWDALTGHTASVADMARTHAIWVLVGSIVASEDSTRPFNTVLVFDPEGTLHGRYDKRLLAQSELRHFTPGDAPLVFEVDGFRCGVAICHEWRYPEIYREYARLGADLVVHSWYDGAYDDASWKSEGEDLADVIPTTTRGHAVCNHLWIVGSNTARPHSCFAPFIVRPDGVLHARGTREATEVVVADLTNRDSFADPSGHHRPRLVSDARLR